MKTVYRYDYVTVQHDEEQRLLYLSWSGYYGSREYMQAMQKMVRLTVQLGVQSWLIDSRMSQFSPLLNMDWSRDTLGHVLEGSSLRRIARIIHTDCEKQNSIAAAIKNVMEKEESSIEIMAFASEEEALAWLLKLQAAPETC